MASVNNTDNNGTTKVNTENKSTQPQNQANALTHKVATARFAQDPQEATASLSTERVSLSPELAAKIMPEKVDQIVLYVQNHPELFAGSSEKLIYIKKNEKEGLPRSIAVKTDGDTLKLYALFKHKVADDTKITGKDSGVAKQKKDAMRLQGDKSNIRTVPREMIAELVPLKQQLTSRDIAKLNREIEFLTDCKGLPHVVQLQDVIEMPGRPHLLETHYGGGDLKGQISKLTMEERYVVIGDFLEGLKGVHGQKIRHADIKPGNIMLDTDKRAHVGDFDQANRLGQPARVGGTPAYLSPEIFQASLTDDRDILEAIDFENDAFAAGMVIEQTLAGDATSFWHNDLIELCLTAMTAKAAPKTLQTKDIDYLKGYQVISGDNTALWPSQIRTFFNQHKAKDLYEDLFEQKYPPNQPLTPEEEIARDLVHPALLSRGTVEDALEKWNKLHPRPA